jgi:hypothetical protein
LSAPKESDITIASANLQIDEVSDSVIVQSTWPIFELAFGKDLFLATLVRILSDIVSFFLQVADGSSDFLRTFLSLSFIQMYHPSYPLPQNI